jgi:hypothetical protein
MAYLDTAIDRTIKTIHIVCENVSTHHGHDVRKWLGKHPRFVFHFSAVHCSWMNVVKVMAEAPARAA